MSKESILLHLHPGKRFLIEIWREDSDNIEFQFYDIKIIPFLPYEDFALFFMPYIRIISEFFDG